MAACLSHPWLASAAGFPFSWQGFKCSSSCWVWYLQVTLRRKYRSFCMLAQCSPQCCPRGREQACRIKARVAWSSSSAVCHETLGKAPLQTSVSILIHQLNFSEFFWSTNSSNRTAQKRWLILIIMNPSVFSVGSKRWCDESPSGEKLRPGCHSQAGTHFSSCLSLHIWAACQGAGSSVVRTSEFINVNRLWKTKHSQLLREVEIGRIVVQGKELARPHRNKNKLRVVIHIYNSSYAERIGKRIMVQGWPQEKRKHKTLSEE
jgi:hypothetical protein